eukprot:jgi/Botrbrau1/3531/Bobra.341_2s0057.1
MWIEFGDWPDSKAASERPAVLRGKLGRARPLVWFMFFNKEEARLVRLLRRVRQLSESLSPPDVPEVLIDVPHSTYVYMRRENANRPSQSFYPEAGGRHMLNPDFVGSQAQFEQLRTLHQEMLRLQQQQQQLPAPVPIPPLAPLMEMHANHADAESGEDASEMESGSEASTGAEVDEEAPPLPDADDIVMIISDDDELLSELEELSIDGSDEILEDSEDDGLGESEDEGSADEEMDVAQGNWPNFAAHHFNSDEYKFAIISKNKMDIPLRRKRTGNILLVKLIDQENRMREFDDDHERANIDIEQIIPFGRRVKLPIGVSLAI